MMSGHYLVDAQIVGQTIHHIQTSTSYPKHAKITHALLLHT